MSSLRNAVQRRNHKERAQPHGRQKWGVLEKHKDYALRAKDHNVKKRKIQDLRAKAATRNDDEFYFGMVNTQSSNGQKTGERQTRSMGQREVMGLKRQDAVYLRSMLQVVRKEMARIEGEVQLLEQGTEGAEIVTLRGTGDQKKGSHLVFVEDAEAQGNFDACEWFGTDEAGLQRGFSRTKTSAKLAVDGQAAHDPPQKTFRKSQVAAAEELLQAKRDEKKRLQAQESRKRRLAFLRGQEQDLVEAEQQLELQRANMAGTSTGGTNKNGQTFKIRERKR